MSALPTDVCRLDPLSPMFCRLGRGRRQPVKEYWYSRQPVLTGTHSTGPIVYILFTGQKDHSGDAKAHPGRISPPPMTLYFSTCFSPNITKTAPCCFSSRRKCYGKSFVMRPLDNSRRMSRPTRWSRWSNPMAVSNPLGNRNSKSGCP